MHDTFITHDSYVFDCPDCHHRWTVSFEARHSQDPDGAELCHWSRSGFPSTSPDAGMPCAACGGVRATAERLREPGRA